MSYCQRLRRLLIVGPTEAIADSEILEHLLFTSAPGCDARTLTRGLVARFGSIAGVFNADARALLAQPGINEASAAAIRSVSLATRRLALAQIADSSVFDTWSRLIDYLTIDMAHLTVERVRVLYLDLRNRLIRDEHIADGSIDEAAIHPREIIRQALDLGAVALILVHNHPSGNPEPSRADIQITNRIAEAGRLLSITVYDHVVIGKEGYVSMRARGLV